MGKPWQYCNEPNRIHYVYDGRHLYEDRGSALYRQLEKNL